MAEEENTEGEGKGGGLNKILIPVALLLVLGVGGYFGWQYFGASSEEGDADALADAGPQPREFGPLVAMRSIVANLADPETTRYIKVTCHLEVTDADEQVALEPLLPPIRNRMLIYLTGLRAEEARGPENQEMHRVGLLNAINNDVFREDRILDLYFTEYVVQ